MSTTLSQQPRAGSQSSFSRLALVVLILAGLVFGLSPAQVSSAATAAEIAAADAAAVSIHNAEDVRGNLYLPSEGEQGSALTWASSDPAVVSTSGVVTRPAAGSAPKAVTLSVTAANDGATATEQFAVTVAPLPVQEEKTGYFFPYFKGETDTSFEEIYFAASHGNSVKSWEVLNDGESVLQSTVGEEGVRDPFIIRSAEGDRFWMIGTDLNMHDNYNQFNFGEAQQRGSKHLVIWESDDLVNWTEPRLVKVSSDFAGNSWAPEAYYDEAAGEYVVYWASAIYPTTQIEGRNIRDSYQRMFYATTRDFVNFSEPQIWVDERKGAGLGMIDATVAEYEGMYYRVIKDEGYMSVRQDRSADLRSTSWTKIQDRIGLGQPNPWGGTFTQGEGPSLFPSNDDPDHWYLLVDQPSYHGGQGYMLFETDNLPAAEWTPVLDADLPPARHGSIIGVTQTELEALYEAFQPDRWLQSSAPVALTVQKGDELQLPATVAAVMGDGSTQQVAVDWNAVDPAKLASVGTFQVTGVLDAGGPVVATANVTVQETAVPVSSLTIQPATAELIVGRTQQLNATVAPLNATGRAVRWTSSNPAVATVDAAGLVRAVAPGTATVTGTTTDGRGTDSVAVTVLAEGGPVIPDSAWVDSFDATTLDDRWTVVRDVPAQWQLTENPGSLTVHTLPGDTWQTANDHENVFMVDVPAGDFTAYTKLNATITANHHAAGLIAWQDHDNYVRTGQTYVNFAAGGPRVIESAVETNAVYASTTVPRPDSTGEWLRLQRAGNTVTASYWDGAAWVTASTMTVSFPTTQVGLYAFAAGAAPTHEVTFDYFALEPAAPQEIVPEGTFTLAGEGTVLNKAGTTLTMATEAGETIVLDAVALTGTGGTDRPVQLIDRASGLPVVISGGRLALGAEGATPATLHLVDAGGGKVMIRTGGASPQYVVIGDGGALTLGSQAAAARLGILPMSVSDHTIDVAAGETGMEMSDTLYGIFYEDINWAADGGIYAELIRNRSFEFNSVDNGGYTGKTAWQDLGSGVSTVRTGTSGWLNKLNRTWLEVNASAPGAGIRNTSWNNGIALKAGGKHDFSVWVRTAVAQDLTVALTDPTGGTTYASAKIPVTGDDTWREYTVTLTPNATTDAGRLALTTGAAGIVNLDMVSLFPQDTWVGPVNGRSVLRKDLAELVEELDPQFLRFPGGCVTNVGTFRTYEESGFVDRQRTYQWKETIGAVEERPTNKNFWGYNQTYGLGYLEYFEWAEDLGAEPLPVVSVGANGCGSTIPEMHDPQLIDRWVQDTLDLIEFANGDVTTEWGAVRAELGHPEPFDLKWIGLGNEENTTTFEANFPKFRDAIAAEYPEIQIISNSGPAASGSRFDTLWAFNKAQGVDLVDEHYYMDPQWFLENSERYDSYDRSGPAVFLGEYASRGNTLFNGLAEAAYMTHLERNSDIVKLASYAPMFANEAAVQWTPDMMWFDNDESWGSVNYYVQKLFMNNVGTHVVPSTLTNPPAAASRVDGGVFLSTWNTAAAYDNVKVTSNADGSVLFQDSFADDSQWTAGRGTWAVANGAYTQTSTTTTDARSIITDAYAKDWSNYTLELDARKISGSEGFLIGFAAGGPDDYYWWNIGGWNNTRSVLQRASGGGAAEVLAAPDMAVTSGQTYKVKVEVQDRTIKLYLDGVLHMTYTQPTAEPLYQVVTRDAANGDLIVKVVNPYANVARTQVNLADLDPVTGVAITELSGARDAMNTKANPRGTVPVEKSGAEVEAALAGSTTADRSFSYDFPAYSITFLRISTTDPVVEPSPEPTTPKPPKPTHPTRPPVPTPQVPYEVPGYHVVNGRQWNTSCEPYSQTIRCRTDIWATVVVLEKGRFVRKTGWHFNNLTYLPMMTRAQWSANPLAIEGEWTSNGRAWRTECDTAQTGQNGCRAYIRTNVVTATARPDGSWAYSSSLQWVFNNIVRFKR